MRFELNAGKVTEYVLPTLNEAKVEIADDLKDYFKRYSELFSEEEMTDLKKFLIRRIESGL